MTQPKYVVTNIKINSQEQQPVIISSMKLPADVNEIHEWLHEFDYHLSDEDAYKAYVRAVLFNRFDITYDYHEIQTDYTKPAVDYELYIVDLNDHDYKSYKTADVKVIVPQVFIAILDDDAIDVLEHDGAEQAIFENMLANLKLEIIVL